MKKLKNIAEALEQMSQEETSHQVRWRALAFALKEMCESLGVDVDYEPEEEEVETPPHPVWWKRWLGL